MRSVRNKRCRSKRWRSKRLQQKNEEERDDDDEVKKNYGEKKALLQNFFRFIP